MKHVALPCVLLLIQAMPALAGNTVWPPAVSTPDGGRLMLMGNLGYDHVTVDGDAHDGHAMADTHGWRRQEIGFLWVQPGKYEVYAGYDTHLKGWADVGARFETGALTGRDLGKLRIGQSRLPVGLEGSTTSRAVSFAEAALVTQAFHQSRRLGVDWAGEGATWLVNAGYYFRSDLNGNHKGNTVAARAAWTPFKTDTRVLHLGLAASRERPDGETDGRGQYLAPSLRLRARAGNFLLPERVVDSGVLTEVQHTRRTGAELLWIGGPWSVQAEYLRQDVRYRDGRHYQGNGHYAYLSWMATGESRRYQGGSLHNPVPRGPVALEVLLRHDRIDLDDAGIAGGHARQWTLGTSAYVGRYLKVQANYLHTTATQRHSRIAPRTFVVRTQLHF